MEEKSVKYLRVIITGATGMVGEGVLHECIQNPHIDEILVVGRKNSNVSHPKVKEIIHQDFYNFTVIEPHLSGYDACFFCLGVSSIGMKESQYYKLTHSLTLSFAETLCRHNPEMTFCYVSGAGTDSTEKGKSMWARVKGKTENDLFDLSFKKVFAFRPGFIKPTKGLKHTHTFYKYIKWLFPFGRSIFPDGFCTMREVGQAMINAALCGYHCKILEVKDIVQLANVPKQEDFSTDILVTNHSAA